MSWILGIGGYSHDASAALLKDGKLTAAVQEERLTRIKHAGGFPYASIKYCLEAGGITEDDVSAVAFYAKRSNWDKYLWDALKASVRHVGYTCSHPRGLVTTVGYRVYRSLNFRADLARFFHDTKFSKRRFFFIDHHACHAAAGYFSSPFDEAIVLCLDGGGDGRTTTAWLGRGARLTELPPSINHPHSLGLIYTRVTRYLGFPAPGDEYKVMGLAAHGKPVYLNKIREMIRLSSSGGYRLNMAYFNYQFDYALSGLFERTFGPPRRHGEPLDERHADIAASLQRLFEEVVLYLSIHLKRRAGIRDIAISGGSALNCLANGRLLSSGEFDRVFVPPAAGDLGTSIGAAQYHYYMALGGTERAELRTDGWGPEFDDDAVLHELTRTGLRFGRLDQPAEAAARILAEGKVVAWFQGRMEFGPRTLGFRSILGDPRSVEIKDRINRTVKFRDEFRPFAPSILREHAKAYFGVDCDSPFMTLTFDVLADKRKEIAGVVHVDNTARVQTVSREDQPLYYDLIDHFYRLTGVPVVLNTSFNLAGEPIVCSPHDALRTFFTSGIDVLIMGRYIVTKE